MSYFQSSRNLNVSTWTNKELNDLIKDNECYSGCYNIIQEKNLKGIDILNLSENSLATWKLPLWKSKKLLSLKETLSKDPESLRREEESLNGEPRKNISSTLSTLLNNKNNKQNIKGSYKKKIDEGHRNLSPKREIGVDDENYLTPFNNLVRRPSGPKFDRSVLQLPDRRGSDESSPTPSRKPVAIPRPDLNDDENEYEPPPRHTSNSKKAIPKLPLPPPPPPTDEQTDYEVPPTIENKLSDYDYIEPDVDPELPPPFPERSNLNVDRFKKIITPVYMNVGKTQSAPINSPTSPNLKNGVKPIKSASSFRNKSWQSRPLPPLPLDSENQLPQPKATTNKKEDVEAVYENKRNDISEPENLPEYGNITESTDSPIKQNSSPGSQLKTLQPYPKEPIDGRRSNFRSFTHKTSYTTNKFNNDVSKEPKGELEKRLSKKESNEISSHNKFKREPNPSKSKVQLPKPPLSVPQNTYFDEVLNKNHISSNDFGHDSDNDSEDPEKPSEYRNVTGAKTKVISKRNTQNLPSLSSQLAFQISQKKLKPVTPIRRQSDTPQWGVQEKPKNKEELPHWKQHKEVQNDVEEYEQEEQPEYGNTVATQSSESKFKNIEKNTQPLGSTSFSQINKIESKVIATKKINLNDGLASELRFLLERRNKGLNENIERREESHSQNTSQQSVLNPYFEDDQTTEPEEELAPETEDDFEEDDYDVAGYNQMLNFNYEPFYRNTDRKGAIELLKDLRNGAFLLRPSSKYFLSITIKNNGKYFNLGIEKTSDHKIFCGEGTMRTQEFSSLKTFLEYFEHNPFLLQGGRGLEKVYLQKVLPVDKFN